MKQEQASMGKLAARLVLPVLLLAGGIPGFAARAAEPPPVEAYGKLPAIETPRLSPGGTTLAFLSSRDGRRCLVLHRLDDDRRTRGLCPGQYEVRWFAWKNDERLILEVYTPSRLAGAESRTESRLLAIDVDGAHLRDLTEPRSQRAVDFGQDQVIDMLPDDPTHVLVSVYRSDIDSPDVVRVNVYTGAMRTAVRGRDGIATWKTDSAGHVRVGIAVGDGKVRTYYRDDPDDPFRLIRADDAANASSFAVLAIGETPGLLYVASSEPTGRRAVYPYEVATGRFLDAYASRPDADIDRLFLDGGRPAGYGYTLDEPEFVFTDAAARQDAEQIAKVLPGYRTYVVDGTADGRRLLVLAAGGSRPGAYYLLTRAGDKGVLGELGGTHPDIPESALAPVQPVSYRARDGLTIHGYVTLPPGKTLPPGPRSAPIPFVVMPHGGPSARDELGFDYIAQMIASRGYGVLQPNYRGSKGYGATFERAGFQQWGLAMQDDVTDGAQWLIDQKLADPKRICIVGWSYGGYAALMGAIKTPDLYRCAASMAGVSDLRRRLDRAVRSRFADLNVPRYDSDPAAIAANSPVLHADRIRIPILLAHGRRDFTVPVEDTEAMERALRLAGRPVEALYFDADDHYLFREEDRIAYLKALDRFLADNLGPGALGPVAGAASGATN